MAAVPLPSARRDRCGPAHCRLKSRELFFDEDGEYPVLLLDDVLSELDRRRQDFVLNRISAGQVMITCCEDGISEKLRAGAVFHIQNGEKSAETH